MTCVCLGLRAHVFTSLWLLLLEEGNITHLGPPFPQQPANGFCRKEEGVRLRNLLPLPLAHVSPSALDSGWRDPWLWSTPRTHLYWASSARLSPETRVACLKTSPLLLCR